MKTQTKLNVASLTATTVSFLIIGSHLLGFSKAVEWALFITIWIPLGFGFSYAKKLKEEQAHDVATGVVAASKIDELIIQRKRFLVRLWIAMVPLTLSFPFWLPSVTGVSLGRIGDFLVAVATFAMISAIFWVQLKKMPNHTAEPSSQSRGGSS